MPRREMAINLAAQAIEQIENGSTAPDTEELLMYAVVLALVDIGERLEEIKDSIQPPLPEYDHWPIMP